MDKRTAQVPELLAVAGVALVLVLVPLVSTATRLKVGPVPLEPLTFAVPLAVLLSVPLYRGVGASRLPRIGFELAAMAFLAIALLSVVFSGSVQSSVGTWLRYAGYVALVPTVALVARSDGRRRVLLWLLVLAGAVTCVLSFIQYLNPTMIQPIGMAGLEESIATRVYATMANPNFYAEYLVLLIGATLSAAFLERGWLRGLASALVVVEAAALALTFTRGSWLALVVGLLVAVLMIDARYIWALVAAGALAVAAVPSVRSRVLSIFSLEGTASFRLRLWRLSGTIIEQNPVLGVGIGQFVPAFKAVSIAHPELQTDFLIYGAHNSYFTLMAEIGLVGGLVFVFMVISACKMGVFYNARMTGDSSARLQSAALTVGLVAFAFNALTSNSFQHPQAAVFFFVLAGLQAGMGARFWDEPVPVPEEPVQRKTGVVGGSVAYHVYRSAVRTLRDVWRESALRRWFVAPPRGDGSVYSRAWVTRALLGEGRPEVAPDGESV